MINNRTDHYDIVIIGGGASGMMAAVIAAKDGHRVLILEHKDKPGRKLLTTGNGRCNYTNALMVPDKFRGDLTMIQNVLDSFSHEDAIDFFRTIGIPGKCRDGYYYPMSDQAASVVSAFENELSRLGVTLLTGIQWKLKAAADHSFLLSTDRDGYKAISCNNLIICCGGKSASKTGSDGSAYPQIQMLGHHFTMMVPALCAFNAEGLNFRKISGVRVDAALTLYVDGVKRASDRGELQLTDYGISGIPTFQISRYASLGCRQHLSCAVQIDFLPSMKEEVLEREMSFRTGHFARETAAWLLNGLLPAKLIPILLEQAGIAMEKKIYKLSQEQVQKLAHKLKGITITLTSPKDFESAQVTCGGIRSEEIDPASLESRILKGLYFAGEILDVDAICGGYNLQWAWSSGYVAAKAAGLNSGLHREKGQKRKS